MYNFCINIMYMRTENGTFIVRIGIEYNNNNNCIKATRGYGWIVTIYTNIIYVYIFLVKIISKGHKFYLENRFSHRSQFCNLCHWNSVVNVLVIHSKIKIYLLLVTNNRFWCALCALFGWLRPFACQCIECRK